MCLRRGLLPVGIAWLGWRLVVPLGRGVVVAVAGLGWPGIEEEVSLPSRILVMLPRRGRDAGERRRTGSSSLAGTGVAAGVRRSLRCCIPDSPTCQEQGRWKRQLRKSVSGGRRVRREEREASAEMRGAVVAGPLVLEGEVGVVGVRG